MMISLAFVAMPHGMAGGAPTKSIGFHIAGLRRNILEDVDSSVAVVGLANQKIVRQVVYAVLIYGN